MIGRLLCWLGLHDYPLEVRGADGWLMHCSRPRCDAHKASGGAAPEAADHDPQEEADDGG